MDISVHTGSMKQYITIAHSIHLNDSYDTDQIVLNAFLVGYTDYQWSLCRALKVISILTGMHIGVSAAVFYVYGTTTVGATADHYEKQL